jgi:hypothetical protein
MWKGLLLFINQIKLNRNLVYSITHSQIEIWCIQSHNHKSKFDVFNHTITNRNLVYSITQSQIEIWYIQSHNHKSKFDVFNHTITNRNLVYSITQSQIEIWYIQSHNHKSKFGVFNHTITNRPFRWWLCIQLQTPTTSSRESLGGSLFRRIWYRMLETCVCVCVCVCVRVCLPEMWGTLQSALLTNAHVVQPLIPTKQHRMISNKQNIKLKTTTTTTIPFDHLTRSQREFERVISIERRIKLGSIRS